MTYELFQSSVIYACQFDRGNLKITACSQGLARALGDFVPGDWIGRYVLGLFSPESYPEVELLLSGRTTSHGLQCRLADEEGIFPTVAVTIDFDVLKEGDIATLLCVPIQNRDDLVERLQNEAENALKRVGNLSDFTGLVVHDLKGILQVLISSVEILRMMPRSADHNVTLLRIEHATQTMSAMLTEILKYTRIDIGEFPSELTNMNVLVDSVFLDFVENDKASIKRLVDLPQLVCEKALVRELFHNLIDNALVYSTKNPIKIEIGFEMDGEEILFFVRDNGVGILEEDLNRVLQPLIRCDHSGLNAIGSGMGLAQVHKIVQRHQGRIWIESVVEKGTTVWFGLGENVLKYSN